MQHEKQHCWITKKLQEKKRKTKVARHTHKKNFVVGEKEENEMCRREKDDF